MKNYDVNVFLIKETIEEFSEVLKEEEHDNVTSYQIKEKYDINGIVYLGENRSNTPRWNEFLDKGVLNYNHQLTKSTRAVLLIKRGGRTFAFTFGYGRHMLKNDSYVRGFGFRVILNNALDGSLKSVDTAIFDENPLNSTIQTSSSMLLSEFNITDIRTMFRSITAESSDVDRYGAIITGKDSFSFSYPLDFSNIKIVCSNLLGDYNSETYKKRFPEIDRIKEVDDPKRVKKLDEKLIDQLNAGDIDDFYLPEMIDWEKVRGFSFTKKGRKDLNLSTERFWDEKQVSEQDVTKDYLRRHKIFCHFNDEVEIKSWTLYNCLHIEIALDDDIYIFSIGQWFYVDNDFVDEINEYIRGIVRCGLEFPELDGEHEKIANEILQSNLPGTLNLDRNNAKIEGDQYEVCDLLTKCKRFIHVKWWNSSATLSHLFSQGRVSADILLNSHDQQVAISDKIREQDARFSSVININSYNPRNYTVVFAIIYPEDEAIEDRLPFFSKANLKHNVSMLQRMNYNVELVHIKSNRDRIKKGDSSPILKEEKAESLLKS